jgi:hypothetical protein
VIDTLARIVADVIGDYPDPAGLSAVTGWGGMPVLITPDMPDDSVLMIYPNETLNILRNYRPESARVHHIGGVTISEPVEPCFIVANDTDDIVMVWSGDVRIDRTPHVARWRTVEPDLTDDEDSDEWGDE